MGMDPATIGLAVGAAGSIAGGMLGSKGTPSQTGTVQKNIVPAGALEQQLQNQSLDNYAQQQAIVNDLQNRLGLYNGIQQQAIGNTQDILSGQAFSLTPQEQQQLSSLRQALIDQSQAPVQQLIDTNLRKVASSAGQRNLRGQALTEQSGRVLSTGAEQLGAASRNAATQVANLGAGLPYQRVAAQQNAINAGLNTRNTLAQQAVNNRQLTQNPALLQSLLRERLEGASSTSTQAGQSGNWVNGLLGAAAGFGGGIQNYSNIRSSFNNLQNSENNNGSLLAGYGGAGASDLPRYGNVG